jgi:hypothetical protein
MSAAPLELSSKHDDNRSKISRDANPQSAPLASSSTPAWSYSSLKEQWGTFQDAQRLERLAVCLQLDQLLKECRQRRGRQSRSHGNSHSTASSPHARDSIESITPGLRTMKYYGWRGILKSTEKEEKEGTTSSEMNAESSNNDTVTASDSDSGQLSAIHQQIQSSCSREQHAVWACRAVATGCGKELASLKKCFEEDHHVYDILTVPHTGYENYNNSSSNNNNNNTKQPVIPCWKAQNILGSCVTANAKQLLERKQQREADAATSK